MDKNNLEEKPSRPKFRSKQTDRPQNFSATTGAADKKYPNPKNPGKAPYIDPARIPKRKPRQPKHATAVASAEQTQPRAQAANLQRGRKQQREACKLPTRHREGPLVHNQRPKETQMSTRTPHTKSAAATGTRLKGKHRKTTYPTEGWK